MLGEWTSASARSSRRRIPPEYVPIFRSPAPVSPTRSSNVTPRSFASFFGKPFSPAWR